MENQNEEKYFHSINNNIIISENPFQIIFTQNKKIKTYEINLTDLSFNKIKEIEIPDQILTIEKLNLTNDIIVVGKTDKTIYYISYKDNKIKYSSICNKKLISLITLTENNINYLLYADKVGEISIKKITENETEESFNKMGKIICGHSDSITHLNISNDKKLLLSCDTFGKLKIYQFPNIFNVLSVIIYHDNDVKFVNFSGENNKSLIVFTKNSDVDIWSLYDYQLQKKEKIEDNVIYCNTYNKNNILLLQCNNHILIYSIDNIHFCLSNKKEIKYDYNKDNNYIFFDYNNKIYLSIFNNQNELNKIILLYE